MDSKDKKELKSTFLFLEAGTPIIAGMAYIGSAIGQRQDNQEIPKLAKEKITFIKGEITEIKENNRDLNAPYPAIPKDSVKNTFVYDGQTYVTYNQADQITPQDRINEKQELITMLEEKPADYFPAENASYYGSSFAIITAAALGITALVSGEFRDDVVNVTDKFNKGVVKAAIYPFRPFIKKTKKPEVE